MTDESSLKDALVNALEGEERVSWVLSTPGRRVLRLSPDGTCQYASGEDLREAAAIFWRTTPDENGSVGFTTITTELGKKAGFQIHRDDTIEFFGGYQPNEATQRVLETFVSLRPR